MDRAEYEKCREEKEHTGLFFPYNTYLCSIPQDFSSVPLHWHEEMELIVIKKGRGKVTVDRETRRVKAGDIVVVIPGQLHAIGQDGRDRMEYENIIFRLELLYSEREDVCTAEFFRPFGDGRIIYPAWIDGTKAHHGKMAECIREIDQLSRERPKGYQIGIKSCLGRFFFLMFSSEEGREDHEMNEKSMERTKKILTRIEETYFLPVTVEEMAEFMGLSQSHFMKFFKQQLGMPFVKYLNEYRLSKAANQLAATSEDVLIIAMNAGFTNISYFNRLFRKKFQMTPLQYRKLQKEEH